ncbi:MAG: hypothetical protein JXB88_26385, partial [Spirochaetales bacterium]|nr:hypothetical protein [Spirochaetales bacterium]
LCNRDIILPMNSKDNKEKDPLTHAIIGADMEVHSPICEIGVIGGFISLLWKIEIPGQSFIPVR